MVSTAGLPTTAGVVPPPLAVPASFAHLQEGGAVVPRPSLPEPGVIPGRTARAVASIDGPSNSDALSDHQQHGTAAAPRATRPLVGSRPSIQRLAVSQDRVTGPAIGPTRSVQGGDHEPVPVRWEPIAERHVQRAPEGVPADLQAELEPVLGTSLSDVKVHRDAETGEAARHLSAKAFTAGGEVFLPDWHGSTSGGEARTILAHELTHVAQQRQLGPSLPDEDSPSGATLESEARTVAGQGPAVPTRPVASGGATPATQRLAGERPQTPARSLPSRSPKHSPDRSPSSGMSPMEVVARVQAAAAAAGIAKEPPTVDAAAVAGTTSSPVIAAGSGGPSGGISSSVVQRLDETPTITETTTSSSADSTTQTATDDPAKLDELARRLYPRFRTRLRQELLADRERSGRLFDIK
jgi:hypothetical protein